MKSFTISGQVQDMQAKEGICGLKVEAWDKDLLFNDLVGSAVTDESGTFSIEFTRKHFKECFLDRQPDLFFKIYMGRQLISSTEDSVLWNIKENKKQIAIEVELPEKEEEGAFLVKGTVLQLDQLPLAGAIVRAVDKDLRHEQALGQTAADNLGRYEIRYTRDQFRRAEKQSADLIVRVYDSETGQLLLDESDIIFNAGPVEVVDLIAKISYSEYERYMAELTPVRDGVPVADLTEKDIQFLHGETGIAAHHIEFLSIAARLGKQTDLPPEIFYGLFRQKLPTILSDLLEKDVEELEAALNASFKAHLIPLHLQKDLDDYLKRLSKLKESDQGIQRKKARERLRILARFDNLDAAKIEKIVEKAGHANLVNDKLLTAIVEAGELTETEAKSIGLNVTLNNLLDDNLELVKTLKSDAFSPTPDGRIKHIEDLITLEKKDWLEILKKSDIQPPKEWSHEVYARLLAKRVEYLYPSKTLLTRLTTGVTEGVVQDLEDLQPLFASNERVFATAFDDLDLGGLDAATVESLRSSHARIKGLANTYPGLAIHALLDNPQQPIDAKVKQIRERIGMITRFHAQNPNKEFLFLDYSPGSDDIQSLDFTGFAEDKQRMVLQTIKAFQRIYAVTGDSGHAQLLLAMGYHSPLQIAAMCRHHFIASTGLDDTAGKAYHDKARGLAARSVIGLMGVKTQIDSILGKFGFDNADPAVGDYLKKIDGWEALFGSLDYCNCEHCRSIFGPAAYFVDLMRFLESHFYFAESGGNGHVAWASFSLFSEREDHPMHLRSRRPDLWLLPLTCEHTLEMVPYLDIINEALENFIALDLGFDRDRLPAPGVTDRSAVENLVYEALQNTAASFRQPFCLPLERLALYLAHFDLTRGDIVRCLAMPDNDQAAAALNLSTRGSDPTAKRAYELIVESDSDLDHLRQLYGLDFVEAGERITFQPDGEAASQNDVQALLAAMGLSRTELGRLIETRFVRTGSLELISRIENVEIRSEKRVPSGEDASVQNDIERVHGLTRIALDRMHRFTRLWRRLDWTIQELDLVLFHLTREGLALGIDATGLQHLVTVRNVQVRFGLAVEEVCALWSGLPDVALAPGKASLLDHLFNLPDFVRFEGRFPKPGHRFLHPAFRDTPPEEPDYTTSRLTAGLNLDDQDLYLLITGLAPSLGIDPASDHLEHKAFYLSAQHLVLLYRHARLAKKLGLTIPNLFRLIALGDTMSEDHIAGLNDLSALLAFYDWWQSSGFTLGDLEHITRPVEGIGDVAREAAAVCAKMLTKIQADKALTFNSSVFAYLEGVTEEQSRDIVTHASNATFIAEARGVRYRVAAGFDPSADPAATVHLPAELSAVPGLRDAVFALLGTYNAPGAVFDDTVFAELENISPEQSQSLVAANAHLIDNVPLKDTYWLTPDFLPTAELAIPAQTPLTQANAKALLGAYSAAEIIPTYLAGEIGLAVDKLKALLGLSGADLTDPAYARALQAREASGILLDLVKTVLPLKSLFKDPGLDADAIGFLRSQPHIIDDLRPGAVTIDNVRLIELFNRFLRAFQGADDERQGYYGLLTAFIGPADKFYNDPVGREAVKQALSQALDAEVGLVLTAHDELKRLEADPSLALVPPATALDTLARLDDYLALSRRLGVSGEVLTLVVADDCTKLNQAANALLSAFRTKYDDEAKWQEKIEPFDNKIRGRKRDALADYLIHALSPARFATLNDLYHHFLLDVQLEGCARTSRIVAANSSVQLYIHRVLMQLEQSRDESSQVVAGDQAAQEWEWRKHYRVWEANRKVFLYPENYLEPDLRDNKTPLFEALESTLLQQKINADSALDAYATYMRGFDEVANLKIAGAYHDIGEKSDCLHFFGVTISDPIVYYYRMVENAYYGERDDTTGIVWHPWRRIDVQIPVKKVSPIVFNGRLYLFWVEISTQPDSEIIGGSSKFMGYNHTMSLNFTELKPDGSWAQLQRIKLNDRSPFEGGIGVIHDPLETRIIESGWIVPFLPKYDYESHNKPKSGYSLNGFLWDRVYPENCSDSNLLVYGTDFQMTAQIDFYKKCIGTPPDGLILESLDTSKLLYSDNAKKLYCIQQAGYYFFCPYAYCSILLEESRIRKVWAHHPYISETNLRAGTSSGTHIATLKDEDEIEILSGSPNDCIIDSTGDLLLLQTSVRSGKHYLLKRIGTTIHGKLSKVLFSAGVEGLLDTIFQEEMGELLTPLEYAEEEGYIENAVKVDELDFEGPYGVYYREIFFHTPFLIADHLNSQGKYADAQNWYHYIFNPFAKATGTESRPQDRNWRYLEFRDRGLDSLRKQLTAKDAIEIYKKDPFNPHAIARLPARFSAYQKAVVMKYIDNLLDWGDSLFAQDTMESINEATLLYVLAADILGQRPAQLGDCGQASDALTYEDMADALDEENEFLVELHHSMQKQPLKKVKTTYRYAVDRSLTYAAVQKAKHHVALHAYLTMPPAAPGPGPAEAAAERTEAASLPAVTESKGDLFLGYGWKHKKEAWDIKFIGPLLALGSQIGPTFCIPANKHLMGYWDRVEDRLFKIRNCMNISGVRRELSLFAPEIDPMLLVRAKAAGLSLEDVLNAVSGNLPPYRFAYLIERAKGYTSMLQGFGSALLSALEKKDVEELNQLRSLQQNIIITMTSQVREQEHAVALASIQSLEERKKSVRYRLGYYQDLLDIDLIEQEINQKDFMETAKSQHTAAAYLQFFAAVCYLLPQFGAPTAMKYGGKQIGAFFDSGARVMGSWASLNSSEAALSGLEAGFKRREQGWQHQIDLADKELIEIEKQIEIAKLRADITERLKTIHYQTVEQQQEIYELYRDKFTNLGLYTWLATTLQGLYREAYNNAYALARLAEQAYRFERGNDAAELIGPNHWDASRAGLLAGERLLMDLQNLERKFLETNYRTIEIDQAFSLTQIDPAALIELKQTGSCQFSIPEIYFNLFYPGHYRRKIRAARLTIPCITGPYTNVSAGLKLIGSWLRNTPEVDADLLQVPLTRTVAIATSTAQNDAGVFELNFRDERYMPFEGAGAVSRWELSLPKNFRQFDYNTINDVILHISYTAEEDSNLKTSIEGAMDTLEGSIFDFLKDESLQRIFSLRQEFSSAFNTLLHSPVNQQVTIELTDRHFPVFLKGRELNVRSAFLVLGTEKDQEIGTFQLSFNNDDIPSDTGEKSFQRESDFGNLFAANVTDLIPEITLSDGQVIKSPIGEHSITIKNAGGPPSPDSPVIEAEKLKDIYIYLEYGLN